MAKKEFIKFFKDLSIEDVPQVGGKNASLGEMYRQLSRQGVKVPNGFATTAYAYNYFLDQAGVKEKIKQALKDLNINDVNDLARRGAAVRRIILQAEFPADLKQPLLRLIKNYQKSLAWKMLMLPCALQPQPKICLTLPLPASRKPTLISGAKPS